MAFADSTIDDSHLTERERSMHRFLRYLAEVTVQWSLHDSHPLPVLRGSLLMRHWFGEHAREAKDVDLELFDPNVTIRSRAQPIDRRNIVVRPSWLIEMTRLALTEADGNSTPPFLETHAESIWQYGTPGGRFVFDHGDTLEALEVDLASQGPYMWDELGLKTLEFTGPSVLQADELGPTEMDPAPTILAYSPELMTAAKLSWVLRSFQFLNRAAGHLRLSAQPKDVFDLHLLLSRGQLAAEQLEQAICLVTHEEDVSWDAIDWLCDPQRMGDTEMVMADWDEFFQHRAPHLQGDCSPRELLIGIAERLPTLLPTFVRPQERPFIEAIRRHPDEPSHFDVYADWLEERDDARAGFIRALSQQLMNRAKGWSIASLWKRESSPLQPRWSQPLADLFQQQPTPWLMRLFGTQAAYREQLCQSLEARG